MLGLSRGLSYIQYPQVGRWHFLWADRYYLPLVYLDSPPPPSEACYGLAPHKQELCYATVSAAMALFDTIITSTEYLSKSILRFFMSCTFLQSSGRWPQRENAHLFSPPLLLNNVLAVWCPFLRSFDPPRCAVKLWSSRSSTSVNRESSKSLRVHSTGDC